MSAFIMSRQQLSDLARTIVNTMNKQSYDLLISKCKLQSVFGTEPDYREIYQMLYRLNALSVNIRYKNEEKEASLTDKPACSAKILDDWQFLKNIECWLYQSCEIENPDNSPLYNTMYILYTELQKYIIHNSQRYNKAKWSY